MTSAQRFEIANIIDDQGRLHRMMESLDRRIGILSRSIDAAEPEPAKPAPVESKPPAQVPPPLPVTYPAPVVAPVVIPEPVEPKPRKPEPAPLLPVTEKIEAATDEPLELRVGTFWMARIGIVILLTGLVFLGNYAYQRIVPLLGPWGKVSMLMLAGVGLGAAGYWMERSRESLKNFGRVLFAGGAATIYYTTYAAHFVKGLQVIESALLGGFLLLAAAGGIAWHAQRKRSETIASIAVLLSFYTSAINSIAGFTLYSSLLLTAVSVYFLWRHHWTRLTNISLFATYGSFAYWRFHQFAQPGATESFGMGLAFLAGYWILFTAGVLLENAATLKPAERTTFLTLNNVAFFGFATHYFMVRQPDAFWMFAIGFGGVLLGLSAVAASRYPDTWEIDGAYLAQGLMSFTAGVVAHFSGPQLALVLAMESTALLACSRFRRGTLYQIGAHLTSLGAFVLAMKYLGTGGVHPWSVAAPVAALFLFDGWWIKRIRSELSDRLISAQSMAFVAPGLILIGMATWLTVPEAGRPAVFSLIPLLALAAFRIRYAELGLTSQLFVPIGGALVVLMRLNSISYPWQTPVTVTVAAILLLHLWQMSRLEIAATDRNGIQLIMGLTAVAASACWLFVTFRGDAWLVAASIAAVVMTGYGLLTRAWMIAAVGQIYSVLAIVTFFIEVILDSVPWSTALTPVGAMVVIAFIVGRWGAVRWPALPASASYENVARGFRMIAAFLFAVWAFEFVPADLRVVFFALGGALQILAGSTLRAPGRIVSGVLYAIAGIALFWMRFDQPMIWHDLLALASIPASLRLSARFAGEEPLPNDLRNALVIIALVSMWAWTGNWTVEVFGRGNLTTAWTVFAFVIFGAGLALRERIYRLGGFAILGLSIGRLFVLDVWRFDSLYRIISFLALGAALLTLSFVYHRFADSLRKYL